MQSSSRTEPPEPILVPALKVGAATGLTGVLTGGVIGTLRSVPHVKTFAMFAGVNTFALGYTYWALRLAMYRAVHHASPPDTAIIPRDRVIISGASGAMAGGLLGILLRKMSNVIPGAIVWGLVGLGGQYAYNVADARHTREVIEKLENPEPKESILDRAIRSKWSPVKRLTKKEYADMLKEKLLAVEADIAITNEEIEKLEREKKESAEEK
ncbi:hypothetical protein L873DRAFT_1704659 [Choiromyces venosus 120613-1]|uniref:Uncharacterized protein n=1 Tax=Choiromyces venosus 120613-1 TaxID=1336337 RepID=A0A3N4J5U3_9PEZI|nr:hypothetical protein L873DRAFT_1704659 [Choiromyces venosus 120613-1]